jgi:hypothetical protein
MGHFQKFTLMKKNENSITTDGTQISFNVPVMRSLILRKAVLWAEIKANEQEYQRMSKQIDELIVSQKDISFKIQKKIAEGQEIAEKLHDIEATALISLGL